MLYLELPESREVALDETLVAAAVEALGRYEDLEKDLTRHVSILDSKLNSLRAYDAPIREMIEVLARQ